MSKGDKIEILQRFLQGTASDEEVTNLFIWFNSSKGNQEFFELFGIGWENSAKLPDEQLDSDLIYQKLKARVEGSRRKEDRIRWIKNARNAAAIFVLGLIIPFAYFYFEGQDTTQSQQIITQSLSNDKVKRLLLADGTTVYLMSGSSLTYPSSFSKQNIRNVELKGEAFFDVAKDKEHPFIVDLGAIGVKVVGTSFNISNYEENRDIDVVLKTGKIDLFEGAYSPDVESVGILPNQLASYSKSNKQIVVKDVDPEKYTSWTEGTLMFVDDPLSVVFQRLEQWYNVEIDVLDPDINNFQFTMKIKSENLDQILDMLRFSTPFRYEMHRDSEGRFTIVVKTK